ncbi:cytochrome P450 [Penicillium hordei]|uniref:NADPH--hemoprotein reductase n=1 Tax=Penicillium hordei TaxID=40994 RepID=A0AAD6EGD1_9EURO|nr:cytochrome P450 [Penicillium hordei]KAJ5616773.1 cytochrome P450 [Penicillium hordei]
MASRSVGDHINYYVHHTNINFRLPTSPDMPILMAPAGTGIAPMRASCKSVLLSPRLSLASAILFYGCSDPNKDFIYKDKLRS